MQFSENDLGLDSKCDELSQKESVLVVGTIRNGSTQVVSDLKRIMNALNFVGQARALVIESDSEDDTVHNLEMLSREDPRIRHLSLGNIEPLLPDRIARLRFCRNRYITEIRENELYKSFTIIAVADLDGINSKIDSTYFKIGLQTLQFFDAVAANQLGPYYDVLALRHPYWSPNNWMSEFNFLSQYLGSRRAKIHSLSNRQIRIPSHLPPIKVESAFGGLCLYRRWVFEELDYNQENSEIEGEIDHVTLSRKIRTLGGNIVIHPGFINSNWTRHSITGHRLFVWLDSMQIFLLIRRMLMRFRRL